MEVADFSRWIGRPGKSADLVRIAPPDSGPVKPRDSSEESVSNNSADPIMDLRVTRSGVTRRIHEKLNSDLEEFIRPIKQHFYIDLPNVPDREAYEYLPDHFVVKRILSEIQPGVFSVKLKSGERDKYTQKHICDLEGGEEAMDFHRGSRMGPRRRRKPYAPGMISSASLEFSDDNDVPRQRLKGKSNSSDLSASDQGSLQSSDNDPNTSDASKVVNKGGHKLRPRTNVRSSRRAIDLLEKSNDFGTKPRRGGRDRKSRVLFSTQPQGKVRRSRQTESSDSEEQRHAGARRSDRARALPRHNMRERDEDDILSHSEQEIGPKVIAIKEQFLELAEDNAFRMRHRTECDACGCKYNADNRGSLIFCQGCTNSYHEKCLGPRGTRDHLVTKVEEGNFVLQCRRCLGLANVKDRIAPDHGVCSGCKKSGTISRPFRARLTNRQEQLQSEENSGSDPITVVDMELINDIRNVMFRCAKCQRAWHMSHLPKQDVDPRPSDVDEDEPDEIDLGERRFDEYERMWICKDCIENNSQIDTLVAWRPADLQSYVPGDTVDIMEESKKEYLIKWRNKSHLHDTWMPGSWVWGLVAGSSRLAFMKKPDNQLPKMSIKDAIPESFFRVDIVFDVRYSSVATNTTQEIDLARINEVVLAYVKYKGLGYEDAIWEKPPRWDDSGRWDDFQEAYQQYILTRYVSIPPQTSLRRHLIAVRELDFEKTLMQKKQPITVEGGEMMPYQIEGLNWLYYQWYIHQNAILADEMGLGKTIQLIAFFATLVKEHKCWPFLVVVPNSTCPNWRREIRKWVPSLRVVTYYGSSVARKLAHDYELFPQDEEEKEPSRGSKKVEVKDIKAHVVIASYESVVEEKTRLSLMRVPWQGLVVDEGQRLKNDKNLLYDSLSKLKFPFKVLLTGTPLQNNARELFNLLQFMDHRFDASFMEAKYESLTNETVLELHELLRPFFLRRTKAQVLTFLPAMAQIILPVTMSSIQKKLYRSVFAKNPQLLKSIFNRDASVATKERHNLNNVLMQLRKTLCHPFLYSREIEERTHESTNSHRNLVEASSKLQLLEIMLPKLLERGHRVLIFSQFLDNLDIVEDFMDGLGMQHRRLDGTINTMEKQKRIDEFNAPDSPYFAFLLSTRSGGVGINLATADTVIILDPDFNPHQDIQALSRAHRIGQKQKVLVFRIMTRGSVEEKIMQIGKKKMALDHVLIQQMIRDDEAGMDLESILRHGAEALFGDDDQNDIVYDSASVDKLLDRSQIEDTKTSEDKSAESQFSFARIWANDKAVLEDALQEDSGTSTPNPTVWDKILKDRERAFVEEEARKAEAFGRGKRKRQTVHYATEEDFDGEHMSPDDQRGYVDPDDVDFQDRDDESDEARESERTVFDIKKEARSGPKRPTIRARPFKRVAVPKGQAPLFNGDGPSDYEPIGGLPPTHQCSACGEYHSIGWCRLKIAGVEHCGLCGLAHIGHNRTCPHLNDEDRVATMLATLKESTEDRDHVEQAVKYLRGIRGTLAHARRLAERNQEMRTSSPQGPTLMGTKGLTHGLGQQGTGEWREKRRPSTIQGEYASGLSGGS